MSEYKAEEAKRLERELEQLHDLYDVLMALSLLRVWMNDAMKIAASTQFPILDVTEREQKAWKCISDFSKKYRKPPEPAPAATEVPRDQGV